MLVNSLEPSPRNEMTYFHFAAIRGHVVLFDVDFELHGGIFQSVGDDGPFVSDDVVSHDRCGRFGHHTLSHSHTYTSK
jgi:hypothetical protein